MGTINLFFSRYLSYVLGSLAVGMLLYIVYLKFEIDDLELKLSDERGRVVIESQNLTVCKKQIEAQNRLIELQRNDYKIKLANYEKMLKENKEVRYKTIYKTVYKEKERKSDECEDIKSVLDSVRELDVGLLR